jgi:glutamate N-acetyltransferase / amino-acid N-acetyltransferase
MKGRWIPGGVTAPQGFAAAGTWAGIKRNRRPDLALILSDEPAVLAGVLTTNRVQAAPVHLCRAALRRKHIRGVLVNSGCANCLTGVAGTRDALAVLATVASELQMTVRDIVPASTGVIGRRLPVQKIMHAVPRLVKRLGSRSHDAAWAILTTDTRPKEVAVEWRQRGVRCRLGGMAKGSGMIEPHMATMLGFFTTDAAISQTLLQRALREACDVSFNRITVDGDMSTNDTVLVLANGRADNARITRVGPAYHAFVRALREAAMELACRLVEDGEGATKRVEMVVTQARTVSDADRCARHVANSPLVKTMIAGGDDNLGRVAAAVGASGVQMNPSKLRIAINGHVVIRGNHHRPAPLAVRRALKGRGALRLTIGLGAGTRTAHIWTCDMTSEYIRINTQYTT